MVGRMSVIGKTAKYLVLGITLAIMIFPMAWMVRVALFDAGEQLSLDNLFSLKGTFGNFVDLFTGINMGRYLFNSFLVGSVVTLGNILFCFMVAYSLARYRNLVNKALFITVVLVLMIPAHIIIIPLYLLCVKTGIYDSYWALILPFIVNPIGIFLVKQYIEAIPPSVEEAARIDGSGEFRIIFRVVMPLCKPALAVLAIQVFFTNWNSFLFPFILTSRSELHTVPVALAMFQGHQAIDWPHLMAGSTVAVLPIMVLFAFLQGQIVSGITAGAIKQ